MTAHLFNPSDIISIIGLLATIKLACATDSIYESVAMWLLLYFVKNVIETTLKSHMSAAAHITQLSPRLAPLNRWSNKNPLRSNPEILNYFVQKCANNKAIAEMNSKIYRYIPPVHVILMQCADDLSAKPCKEADVYDKSTFNDFFIEGTDPPVCHRFGNTGYTVTSRLDRHCFYGAVAASSSKISNQTNTNNQVAF